MSVERRGVAMWRLSGVVEVRRLRRRQSAFEAHRWTQSALELGDCVCVSQWLSTAQKCNDVQSDTSACQICEKAHSVTRTDCWPGPA